MGVSSDHQTCLCTIIDLTLCGLVYMMRLLLVAVIETLVVYDVFLRRRCYAAMVGCCRFDCWSLIFACLPGSAEHWSRHMFDERLAAAEQQMEVLWSVAEKYQSALWWWKAAAAVCCHHCCSVFAESNTSFNV